MENLEVVQPMFVHPDLMMPELSMRRFNAEGKRFYYAVDRNDNIFIYPSVTSVLGAVLPKEEYLIEWIAERGMQQARIERDTKAAYGTAMHALIAEFMINKKIVLDFNYINGFVLDLGLKYYEYNWIYDLQKDLIAFARFANDYNLKPLAVEICLQSHIYKVAGAIDLVCEMTVKNEKINAIVDFKSSRKGYNPITNLYQLHLYRQLWKENFNDVQIDKLYNWSPKDFRTAKATYTLTDQTDKINMAVLDMYVNIYHATNKEKPKDRMIVKGELIFGEESQNIEFLPIEDYLKLCI